MTAKAKKTTKTKAKKTASKKTSTKKVTKKTTAKKKTAAKKATVKKSGVAKKSMQDYMDVINWKKWEAHNMDWLYIEVNAGDLMTELEAGVNNLSTCCNAIMECMLEGDGFIHEPKEKNNVSTMLTVRYYCDNLNNDRKKWSK